MKGRAPAVSRDVLTAEIAALSDASFKDVCERRKTLTLYGNSPCGNIGRTFLI
jgi:hypothetical protein